MLKTITIPSCRTKLSPTTHSGRLFSTAMSSRQPLRIGYVPEHFSTPLYFAQQYFKLDAQLLPYPSGTGHMVQALKSNDIDVGIGLTEGWIAGLGKDAGSKPTYQMIGTYVESPLCWAISTGSKRDDIGNVTSLKGGKIGVSRIGSGSFVMGFVLAEKNGWLTPDKQPFEPIVLNTFKELRRGVNEGTADFFMWEHFTSKRYYDNGEIRRVGELYTPWSSWKIVAQDPSDSRLSTLGEKLNQGISYFRENPKEAVDYISANLDYSAEDAIEWMKTVRFADDVKGVSSAEILHAVKILETAGVLKTDALSVNNIVAVKRDDKGT